MTPSRGVEGERLRDSAEQDADHLVGTVRDLHRAVDDFQRLSLLFHDVDDR